MKKMKSMLILVIVLIGCIYFLAAQKCPLGDGSTKLTGRLVTVNECGETFPENCIFFTGYDVGEGDPYELTIPDEAMELFEERCSLDESSLSTHLDIKGTIQSQNGVCDYAPLFVVEDYSFHH